MKRFLLPLLFAAGCESHANCIIVSTGIDTAKPYQLVGCSGQVTTLVGSDSWLISWDADRHCLIVLPVISQ